MEDKVEVKSKTEKSTPIELRNVARRIHSIKLIFERRLEYGIPILKTGAEGEREREIGHSTRWGIRRLSDWLDRRLVRILINFYFLKRSKRKNMAASSEVTQTFTFDIVAFLASKLLISKSQNSSLETIVAIQPPSSPTHMELVEALCVVYQVRKGMGRN